MSWSRQMMLPGEWLTVITSWGATGQDEARYTVWDSVWDLTSWKSWTQWYCKEKRMRHDEGKTANADG